MEKLVIRQSSLSAYLVQFCRLVLRQHGFEAGTSEQASVLDCLRVYMPSSYEEFRMVCKISLAKSITQWKSFDALFDDYWKELERAENSRIKEDESPEKAINQPKSTRRDAFSQLKSWLYNGRKDEEIQVASYSPAIAGSDADLMVFDQGYNERLNHTIHRICMHLADVPSRRYQRHGVRKSLDMRSTIIGALRKGGELEEWAFHTRKKRKTRLVLLCDVSRSMELYTQFMLRCLFGFSRVAGSVRAFVFSTALTRVDPLLQEGNMKKSLETLSGNVDHWGGGTRIGSCFRDFLERYGYNMLNRRAVVMIMSDGWDTGETELLAQSMRRIQRRAGLVIWLNPLARTVDYEPEVKGMLAAKPYIDFLGPLGDLLSLQRFSTHLARGRHV